MNPYSAATANLPPPQISYENMLRDVIEIMSNCSNSNSTSSTSAEIASTLANRE